MPPLRRESSRKHEPDTAPRGTAPRYDGRRTLARTRQGTTRHEQSTGRGANAHMYDDAVATFDLETVLRFSERRRSPPWARPARRSTRSTSTRSPTATPARTCSSPSSRPATRCSSGSRATPTGDLRVALTGVRPRRPARRARQLRRDPLPARRARCCKRIGEAGPDDRSAPGVRRGTGAGDRGQLRRGRPAGRGHHPVRRRGGQRGGGRGRRADSRQPARSRDPGRRERGPRRAGPHPRAAPGAQGRRRGRRRRPRPVRDPRRRGDRGHRQAPDRQHRTARRAGDPGRRCRPAT